MNSLEDVLIETSKWANINALHEKISHGDLKFFKSLGIQLKKNVNLTERQTNAAKLRIKNNIDAFNQFSWFNEKAIETNSRSLRLIDREKSINLIKIHNKEYMCLKFPFKTKFMNKIKKSGIRIHKQKSITGLLIQLNEENLAKLYQIIKTQDFNIENELKSLFDTISKYQSNEDCVPGIYNGIIKNLCDQSINALKNDIGDFNNQNLLKYLDRSYRYGLCIENITIPQDCDALTVKIATRTHPYLRVNTTTDLNKLFNSVNELDRWPLLVVIRNKNHLDQAKSIYEASKQFIPNNEQSFLFRLPSNDKIHAVPLHVWCKENNLYNHVTPQTKIVYVLEDRFPKRLLQENWKPKTSISYFSHGFCNYIQTFVNYECDLHLHIDDSDNLIKYKRRDIF